MRHATTRCLSLAAVVTTLGAHGLSAARAAEPIQDMPNECVEPDAHARCVTAADCAGNERALVCFEHTPGDAASRRCENPCESGSGVAVSARPGDCAIGETCVEGRATPSRKAFYCKPSSFRVDLNLLDQCVSYHLGGLQPIASDNTCSLEANLTRLLDQNGDSRFDIFDLDLCILAFLEQPGCDRNTASCADPDLVFCRGDGDCGDGLYCDEGRNVCQRDCGVVASREAGLSELDRECSGNAKVCDFARGRCVAVDVTLSTCDVDSDCTAGAYCFLGRCAPRCYRSADCPSGGWYCTENNRCRALAPPDDGGGFVFDPENYAIRFARDQMKLDAVQTTELSAMVILDLITKKVVVGNPSVSFGYRLELSYALKQDSQCLKPFVDCALAADRPAGESEVQCRARQDDCFIDDTENWVTLASPFGTISALGNTDINIALDTAAADRLSPGIYTATLRAIFDNGDSDSIPIVFTKASPSGEYEGSVTVYKGTVDNALNGSKTLPFGMRLKVYGEQPKVWNTLLQEYHLAPAGSGADANSFVDITSGQLVHGLLHGRSAFAFAKGGARTSADNEIPFVGLYSPQLGRLRVIGLIDIAADFCISENGACSASATDEVQVRNPFARPIRRQIEFIGPFDEATGRFHGIYREKITGLAADYAVTLEGGFIMDQIIADDSPIGLVANSLLPVASTVSFPADAAVLAAIDADIATYCSTGDASKPDTAAYAKSRFLSKATFDDYIASSQRSGPATTFSPLGRKSIFPQLRQFKDTITEALAALGSATPQQQQNHLSVYDFLSGFILPCSASSASPPPVCVAESSVRCGLALHRKALVSGWVSTSAVAGPVNDPTTGELDLFCPDTIPLSGCPQYGSQNPSLFAMQEHNRFWLDLSQILKFDADKARSDAFLVLFRNEVNPFVQGAALSYKMDKLRKAVGQYDLLVKEIVGTAAAKVLFIWPGRAFKSTGNDWLQTMQTIVSDRMDAIADLVDIQRRIAANTGATNFIFADHMMQNEYLVQVYLMELQSHWQRELFAYRGAAGPVFERGQSVLNQLNPAKNGIGVTPERVFFENTMTRFYNWQGYRDRLVGPNGLVGEAKGYVDAAVTNLKSALSDLDAFERALYDGRRELTTSLNELCGDPTPGNPATTTASYCQQLLKQYQSHDDFARARDCKFKAYLEKLGKDVEGFLGKDYKLPTDCSNDFVFDTALTCLDNENGLDSGNDCKDVVLNFIGNTAAIGSSTPGGDLIATPPTCKLTETRPTIDINGVARPCVGGEMGRLLQEQAMVDLQRRTVIGSVETLLKRIIAVYQLYAAVKTEDATLRRHIVGLTTAALVLDTIVNTTAALRDSGGKLAEAGECIVIGGLAVGTDCPQKVASSIGKGTLIAIMRAIEVGLTAVKGALEEVKEVAAYDHDVAVGKLEGGAELQAMEREADSLIDEYNVLTQNSFNLLAQMEDARFRADEAVRLYGGDVTFVAEHLVGRESGNYLLGEVQVRIASERFREIVQTLYRMTVAFIHHFNVPPGDAAALVAQAQSVVTLSDVDAYVGLLDRRASEYCGLHGLDCDYETNTETLRVSLRDTLFPNLRDIIDARTGEVVTAGQQFHNIITRPPFLKRRIRVGMPTDQIEIPFSTPAIPLQNTRSGNPEWLVDPLSCNQLIDGRDPSDPTAIDSPDSSASMSGSLAVNFLGTNIDDAARVIRYQIVRGATDFVRSCQPESVTEEFGQLPVLAYPIRKHVVGYAPQSSEGQKEAPASFATVSQPFTACVNTAEAQGTLDAAYCWRYFARDRSLASPDWKLLIPLEVGGAKTASAWIADTDQAADAAPVIEDIVVYVRYRSRPIEEN